MSNNRNVQSTYPVRTGQFARSQGPARPAHRERDFGIGYGSSSGYGQERRYTENRTKSMFRCS